MFILTVSLFVIILTSSVYCNAMQNQSCQSGLSLREAMKLAVKKWDLKIFQHAITDHTVNNSLQFCLDFEDGEDNIIKSALKIKNPAFLETAIQTYKNNHDSLLRDIRHVDENNMCALMHAAYSGTPAHLNLIISTYKDNERELLEDLGKRNTSDGSNALLSTLLLIQPKNLQIIIDAYKQNTQQLLRDIRSQEKDSQHNCLLKSILKGNFNSFCIIVYTYLKIDKAAFLEDIRMKTFRGSNCLNLAATNINPYILRAIITCYKYQPLQLLEDLSVQYSWTGMNALMEAVYQNRPQNVELILNAMKGANNHEMIGKILSTKNRFGQTVVDIAEAMQYKDIFNILIQFRKEYFPIKNLSPQIN